MNQPNGTTRPTADRPTATPQRDSDPLSLRIRALAFWSAIGLPFVHIPLLFTGLSTWVETTMFLLLLGCNLVALYVGHEHCQSNGR
ncbi:hypothetical protein C483_01054 [Natrialba hulunbeirensis JCM 10989]|uniref:Uncharacterized protein n=2 Tax=Natrialba hulunbeirensis TaxID=123783 RepID=M0AAA7_9EURY|nr:hypothetical protein C483_01054 [Natrialba hulunbeirensis JCM 10989]